MAPKGKRTRVLIEPSDEERLVRALNMWAHARELVALRTRAFVLLLWDGSVRTSGALALNVEDVVKKHEARRPAVRKTVTQRPCDANDHEARAIVLSARARDAIADYLSAAQQRGLLRPRCLRGPLFLADVHHQEGKRLSKRSAIHWWERFQKTRAFDCTREYQLDDVVYAGRMAYLEAAGWDTISLSEHAGISRRWAAEYGSASPASTKDIMAKLDRHRLPSGGGASSLRTSPRTT